MIVSIAEQRPQRGDQLLGLSEHAEVVGMRAVGGAFVVIAEQRASGQQLQMLVAGLTEPFARPRCVF